MKESEIKFFENKNICFSWYKIKIQIVVNIFVWQKNL